MEYIRKKFKNPKERSKNISKAVRKFYKNGGINPMKGKKRPDLSKYNTKNKKGKTLEKQYGKKKSIEIRKGNSLGHIGDKNVSKRPEIRLKLSGKNCHFWKGGISYIIHPKEFSKELKIEIRKRDKFVCQVCGKNGWCIHHINYNKFNNNPNNLVALCNKCHCKTNFNRKYWIEYFRNKI